MTALDPATGRERWRSDQWNYAEPLGRFLLSTTGEQDSGAARLWVIDPATGLPLGNFGRWQGLGPAPGGQVYGKLDAGRYRMFYGRLDPVRRTATILGRGEAVNGNCQTSADALVCRLADASVGIWRLR
jgi:hypothetical protein